MTSLYEQDFYAWTIDQADHLRKREFNMIDMEHLVEELEALSGSDQRALRSHMANVLTHLLKRKYQPPKDGKPNRSWEDSIDAARDEIRFILKSNPSFKRFLPEFLPLAYKAARVKAYKETGLETDTFPKECPWTLEEILEPKEG